MLEARRPLVVRRLAHLERVLRVLPLAVRALEALDRCRASGRASSEFGCEVGVAARPVRRGLAVLVRLEGATLDDAHLRLAALARCRSRPRGPAPPLVMKPAIVVWWKLKYDRIGLSSGKKVCSASTSGLGLLQRRRRAPGTPVRLDADQRVQVAEQAARGRARGRRGRAPSGPRSSAGPFRSFTSGCVLREKSSSRAIVAFYSSRKVGKIANVSAQRLVARGGGLEDALRVHDQLAQRAAALVDRAEHLARCS